MLCNQVGEDVNTGHGYPTAQDLQWEEVKRPTVWFSGKHLPLFGGCRAFFFSFLSPLFAFINANILQQERVSTKAGVAKEAGFCSSPAASMLIMLRTNMKHTHATASQHTHLTSIRHTDGELIFRWDSRSHLSAKLPEKKRRVGWGTNVIEKSGYFLQLSCKWIQTGWASGVCRWSPHFVNMCLY